MPDARGEILERFGSAAVDFAMWLGTRSPRQMALDPGAPIKLVSQLKPFFAVMETVECGERVERRILGIAADPVARRFAESLGQLVTTALNELDFGPDGREGIGAAMAQGAALRVTAVLSAELEVIAELVGKDAQSVRVFSITVPRMLQPSMGGIGLG